MRDIYIEVAEAKEELEIATVNFNQATNRDAIDYWIYRILSAQTRYDLLMKEIRAGA